MSANKCDTSNDFEIQEHNSDNAIVLVLGENILINERNDALKLELENAKETHEVEKIANDSMQRLLATFMNKPDKEKSQVKKKHDIDDVEMHVLGKTIKTFVDEDKNGTNDELKEEIEAINNACGDATNVLLYQFCKACSRLSRDFEDTDQSLMELCTMPSRLKKHFKDREKIWLQKVAELTKKWTLLEKRCNRQIDDARLNDNKDAIETLS